MQQIFLKKLTVSQLAKKFLASYGIKKPITTYTTAHHLTLSYAMSKKYINAII